MSVSIFSKQPCVAGQGQPVRTLPPMPTGFPSLLLRPEITISTSIYCVLGDCLLLRTNPRLPCHLRSFPPSHLYCVRGGGREGEKTREDNREDTKRTASAEKRGLFPTDVPQVLYARLDSLEGLKRGREVEKKMV